MGTQAQMKGIPAGRFKRRQFGRGHAYYLDGEKLDGVTTKIGGIPADPYQAPEVHMPRVLRAAQRRAHPDSGGDAATFQRVTLAEAKLR